MCTACLANKKKLQDTLKGKKHNRDRASIRTTHDKGVEINQIGNFQQL